MLRAQVVGVPQHRSREGRSLSVAWARTWAARAMAYSAVARLTAPFLEIFESPQLNAGKPVFHRGFHHHHRHRAPNMVRLCSEVPLTALCS